MRLLHMMVSILLVALFSSCAGTQSGAPAGARDVLTHEQLNASTFTSAYDAIQALRPHWLQTRGQDSFMAPGEVQVYQNDSRLGGVEMLRYIGTSDIASIRHFDGISASGRWGLDHGHGVIFVTIQRR